MLRYALPGGNPPNASRDVSIVAGPWIPRARRTWYSEICCEASNFIASLAFFNGSAPW